MHTFVAAMGQLNVDILYSGMPRIPAEGEEVFSQGFDLQLGGGPPATLINLRRLGVPVRLGTFLGRDPFSLFARRILEDSGVAFTNLQDGDDGLLTVTSIISTARDRTFVSHRPREPMAEVPPERVRELHRGCSIAYVPLCQHEAWHALKREGALIVMDSSWREDLSLELYREAFSYVDYFTPNEKEALAITGAADPLEAARILARHVPGAIVKLGADGCLFAEGKEIWHVPAARDQACVDTTGAGDAFLGGFIYGLFRGYTLERAVRLGTLSGTCCVAGVGCLASYYDEPGLMAREAECLGRGLRAARAGSR
jgi:ribokinase